MALRTPELAPTQPIQSSSSVEHNASDVVSEKDGNDMFKFLLHLRSQALLPVMIFHSDRNLLNQYHTMCTERLIAMDLKITAQQPPAAAYNTGKPRKNPTNEELQEAAETRYFRPPPMFGMLEREQLRGFFKHHGLHLGFAGRAVQKSQFYPGIRRGLGIHHHGVERQARNAVESALRSKDIHVVFCDASLAFGLNLPVKTVVMMTENNEMLEPSKFLQAAGRAGRWGHESCGNLIFYGGTPPEAQNIWKPFHSVREDFPTTFQHLLPLLSSVSPEMKACILRMIELDVPTWGWNGQSAFDNFAKALELLTKLGALSNPRNKAFSFETRYQITLGGKAVLALGMSAESYFCGYCIAKKLPELERLIQSSKDFFFFVSHCVGWRSNVTGYGTLKPGVVDAALWELIQMAREEFLEVWPQANISESLAITSLFVDDPSLIKSDPFPHTTQSLLYHVSKKAKALQAIVGFSIELE